MDLSHTRPQLALIRMEESELPTPPLRRLLETSGHSCYPALNLPQLSELLYETGRPELHNAGGLPKIN